VHKAYKKLSLVVHPDRVSEDEKLDATEKFKVLGKIHSILNDKDKRAAYDETGIIEDGDECELEERDWSEYWRLLFKEITEEDIVNYEKNYKGSDEEKEDLKKAYMRGKGDMDIIFDWVPFVELSEEGRIREIIETMIAEGQVPAYKEFTDESPRKKQRRKRKKELEKKKQKRHPKKNGTTKVDSEPDENGAMMAILRRKKEREAQADSFFKHLEAKYGGGGAKVKSTGKRKAKD
ncbi:hypothetical protein AAG570_005435, partial [Ranatra chinensis]